MDALVKDRVLALMATQHGLISTEQLHRVGVDRNALQVMQRQRLLVRVGPGVYASPAAHPTIDHRRTLAILACPDGVLSHGCAARVLGFDRWFTHDDVEVTRLRRARGSRLPFIAHTTKELSKLDCIRASGYPCTSGTRTVIDLARLRVPVVQLEAAVDSSVRGGWSAPLVIVTRLGELRGPGRWGARTLDRLLLDSGGHTMLERRFLELVRLAGFPRPRTQVIFRHGATTFARVDFIWESIAVVVEVSGSKGHSTPSERAKDAQRRNELQEIGFKVYEYTYEQVMQQRSWVIQTLQTRLRAA